MELQTVADVREFFRDALQAALGHQHLHRAGPYRALHRQPAGDVLEHGSAVRSRRRPHPAQAARAPARGGGERAGRPPAIPHAAAARRRALRLAGFLAGGFARRPVDVDYHIAMGGRAYGTLAQAPYHGAQRVLGGVFAELGAKFQPLVDALSEIGEAPRRTRRATCCASTSSGTGPAARARTECSSSSASGRSRRAGSPIEPAPPRARSNGSKPC